MLQFCLPSLAERLLRAPHFVPASLVRATCDNFMKNYFFSKWRIFCWFHFNSNRFMFWSPGVLFLEEGTAVKKISFLIMWGNVQTAKHCHKMSDKPQLVWLSHNNFNSSFGCPRHVCFGFVSWFWNIFWSPIRDSFLWLFCSLRCHIFI